MKTIVRGKNVEVPDRVRAYAERKLRRLERMLDEGEFLSPHGVRSVSRRKTVGGKRSIWPERTPLVSLVSMLPSAMITSPDSGPSAVNEWTVLPKGSED